MKSRERVLTALDHKEPDRVPIDLGGTAVSSVAITTYKVLRSYLGLPEIKVRIEDVTEQIAFVDDDVCDRFGIDVIPVFANPPSKETVISVHADGSSSFMDDFGATLIKPTGSYYYDWRKFPLPEPSIDRLKTMPWPDPTDPARYKGLRQRVQKLRSETDRALFGMAPCGHDLFNQLFRVRGMENGLTDFYTNADFVEAFLDKLTDTIICAQTLFLSEVGDLIDIHFTADDLSSQTGPLTAPDVYRSMIKPRWAKIIQVIKRKTNAKILYHSCGALVEFIPDLIDIGVDIINPVQVAAKGMDPKILKEKFGENLSFWGGGCDTQFVLNQGTPEQVSQEVRKRISQFAPGGGFIFNPVHNIQPLIKPQNIVAMFDTAIEFGKYKI